jgi:hypothetical protein
VSTAHRRRRVRKNREDFFNVDKALKFRILEFAVYTLIHERNSTFRKFFDEILFVIVKEGEQEYLGLLEKFCKQVLSDSSEFLMKFVAKLHSGEHVVEDLQL